MSPWFNAGPSAISAQYLVVAFLCVDAAVVAKHPIPLFVGAIPLMFTYGA